MTAVMTPPLRQDAEPDVPGHVRNHLDPDLLLSLEVKLYRADTAHVEHGVTVSADHTRRVEHHAALATAAQASEHWGVVYTFADPDAPTRRFMPDTAVPAHGVNGTRAVLDMLTRQAEDRARHCQITRARRLAPSPHLRATLWIIDDLARLTADAPDLVAPILQLAQSATRHGIAVWAGVPNLRLASFADCPALRRVLTAHRANVVNAYRPHLHPQRTDTP